MERPELRVVHYRLFPDTGSNKTYHTIANVRSFVMKRGLDCNVIGVRFWRNDRRDETC